MKIALKKLAEVCNYLDSYKEYDLSDQVELILVSLAQDLKSTVDSVPEDLPQETYYANVEEALRNQESLEQLKISPEEINEIKYDLSNVFGEDVEEHKAALAQIGATMTDPIFDGGFLGEGAYGIVYGVHYQGKELAAKVSEDPKELGGWKKVLNVRSSLSPRAQETLPRIYFADKVKTNQKEYTVVIMERLVPLPRKMQQMLAGTYQQELNDNQLSLVYEALIDGIYDAIYNIRLETNFSFESFPKPEEVAQVLMKDIAIKKKVPPTKELLNRLKQIDNKVFKYVFDDDDLTYSFRAPLVKSLYKSLQIPLYGEDDIFPEDFHPEMRQVAETLKELSDHGVTWGDLNYSNMMYSPDRNIPVLIDFGAYR